MEENKPLIERNVEVPGTRLNIFNLVINNIIVCLLSVGTNMYQPVMNQYIYHRVADSVFGNDSRIKNFSVLAPCFQNTSDEGYLLVEKAQELTATKTWQLSSVSAGIAVFSNIVLGSYSDIIGRKFLFLCPMAGHLLRNGMTAIIIYWHLDINFFFIATGIDGLFGGDWALLLATMTFAADNTPPAGSRSLSIVIIECVIGLSESVASTATGYFIQDTGFFYPSLTSAGITLIDMGLVATFIKSSYAHGQSEQTSLFSGVKNFKEIYFDGAPLKRSILWIGVLLMFFTSLNISGESNIYTLFLMNLPFCMSPENIGIYDSVSSVVRRTVGVGITRMLLCCFTDHILGVLGILSDIGGSLLYAFATVNWMLYIGYPVVGILGYLPVPMVRSILSKQVPYNRQGTVFASMSVVQAVCTVFATVVFNNIYSLTVSFWRGAVYMSYAVNNGISLLIFIILTILLRKQRRHDSLTLDIQKDDTDR